jgi:hypothetical protein
MLLEDILLFLAAGSVLLVVGFPIARLLKAASVRRKDPLAEAQERLRIAKLELEAARVNREAEEIYKHLYDEALDQPARARVAPDEEGAADSERAKTEKEKTHGKE